MNRFATSILLWCVVTLSASAQTALWNTETDRATIWVPLPLLQFDDSFFPKATVRSDMIVSLRVGDVNVDLDQKTKLETMQVRFGGRIGAQGDGAESLEWLCLHGSDSAGLWVLWLDSDELDGPYVGGFRWQRTSQSARFDERCAALPDTAEVKLPVSLTLGMSEGQVLRTLGQPTLRKSGVLFYKHDHTEMIRGEEFMSSNQVTIALRNGVVWAIDVSKSPLIN